MHRAPVKTTPQQSELIDSLLTPAAFAHPVTTIELIETHISWLILTDEYVYKLKKPVVLDFLDFGTLERRRFFCEEELRLNRPWAPGIYLDVVAVTRKGGRTQFGGDGEIVDYAVRMRRFDQRLRLDHQLEDGKLAVADMRELATNIAARHEAAARTPKSRRAPVLRLTREFMCDNFTALAGKLNEATLTSLQVWTNVALDGLSDLIARRFDAGFVRDCHGDLHLGNLVRLPDGITTFDCIEFNSDLRDIDVMCDVAFLVMDLAARQRDDLGAHFLNRYLEATGDYAGIALLRLFFVYRCLVRAKVAIIRSSERDSEQSAHADLDEAGFYADLAMRQTRTRSPLMIVMHGLSGSGKTWVSAQLMAALPAIRVRSDIERKRLFGLGEQAPSHSPIGRGIYTESASAAVYARLFELAATILSAGHDVILDAAFLDADARATAMKLAREQGCPLLIVDVIVAVEVLQDRLRQRAAQRNDASEADLAVLDHQLEVATPLSVAEQVSIVTFRNEGAVDVGGLVEQIRQRRGAAATS